MTIRNYTLLQFVNFNPNLFIFHDSLLVLLFLLIMKPDDIKHFIDGILANLNNILKEHSAVILGILSLFIPSIVNKIINKNKEILENKKLQKETETTAIINASNLSKSWQEFAKDINEKYKELEAKYEKLQEESSEKDKKNLEREKYILVLETYVDEVECIKSLLSENNANELLDRLKNAKNPKR